MNEKIYENQGIRLKYYESRNSFQPLVLIHAQGVDGQSYASVAKQLSKKWVFAEIGGFLFGKGWSENIHCAKKGGFLLKATFLCVILIS